MRRNKLTFLAFVSVLSLAVAACGGDDDGGGGTADAAPAVADAAPNITPDAMPVSSNALGQACTFDMNSPQADCPANHVCVSFQGGSGAYCSMACTGQADTVCNTDYTGPGVGVCYIGVDTTGDNMPDAMFCGIICGDSGAGLCNATTCDGTCPAPLQCTSPLSTAPPNPMQVATGCQ